MKQNNFDLVMDYIDANISQEADLIKKGINNLIGYNKIAFGYCLMVLTGKSLHHYIIERKMYFAAQSLINDNNRPIADIALEYGYSEQSAFSRAFKEYFNVTPLEVRKGTANIPDNKYKLADFCNINNDSVDSFDCIANELKKDMQDWRYMEKLFMIEEMTEDCFFLDHDACYKIYELAERLEVSFVKLIEACEQTVIDSYSDSDYLPPEIETATLLGISSDEEMEDICNYYNCKYYDLDSFMVKAYKDQLKSN